jgi:hypothetical protein
MSLALYINTDSGRAFDVIYMSDSGRIFGLDIRYIKVYDS